MDGLHKLNGFEEVLWMHNQVRTNIAADVDTGIDDALALVYLAALHNNYEINLRVSTSAGNCTAQQATANSVAVLSAAGARDVVVTAGATEPLELELTTTPETHGECGLGYYTPALPAPEMGSAMKATRAWHHAQRLLVAGPATNVAWALRNAPEVLANTQVTMMVGAFDYPGNTTDTAEWNAWVDPHALAEVVASSTHPTLVPLNVTEKVILTPQRLQLWVDHLSDRPELAKLLEEALRFYFEFHESVGVGYCAQIHDLAAAMVMLDRIEYQVEDASVEVLLDGKDRGTTVATAGTPNARIVREFDPEAVFAEFERALFGSVVA